MGLQIVEKQLVQTIEDLEFYDGYRRIFGLEMNRKVWCVFAS